MSSKQNSQSYPPAQAPPHQQTQIQQPHTQVPTPYMPLPPQRSTSNVLLIVIVVIIIIIVMVAVILVAIMHLMVYGQVCGGGGSCSHEIGTSIAISADGKNWTMTFNHVYPDTAGDKVYLWIKDKGGDTVLSKTGLSALTYATDKADYHDISGDGDETNDINAGDYILISATTYPTGCTYMLLYVTEIAGSGTLQAPSKYIGTSIAKSADGKNWTMTFNSVDSGMAGSQVYLLIKNKSGDIVLSKTALSALTYATNKADYYDISSDDDETNDINAGDYILISTTTYTTGYTYQLLWWGEIADSGTFQAPSKHIGTNITKSGDGKNWTITFNSVDSGMTGNQVYLLIKNKSGDIVLQETSLSALTYTTDKADYHDISGDGDEANDINAGDYIVINTTTYTNGFAYQLLYEAEIAGSGTFE